LLILAALAALLGEPSVAAAAEDEAQREAADLVTAVLVFGLSGIAAVALVGSALLLAGRRDRGRTDPSTTIDAGRLPPDVEPPRRAMPPLDAGLSEDPIVASMGFGQGVDANASRPSGGDDGSHQRGRATRR
jgi:hypothetical protein